MSEPEVGPGFTDWIVLLGKNWAGKGQPSRFDVISFAQKADSTFTFPTVHGLQHQPSLLFKSSVVGPLVSLASQRKAKPILCKVLCILFCAFTSRSRFSYHRRLLLWASCPEIRQASPDILHVPPQPHKVLDLEESIV